MKKNPPTIEVTQAPPAFVNETTASGDLDEDDDYYDVFDDFYDYEEEEEAEPVESEPKAAATEAKSEKKKKEKEGEAERGSFLDGLPSDIYCDLVTTLDKRFVVSSDRNSLHG